jgi:hypothetical protein
MLHMRASPCIFGCILASGDKGQADRRTQKINKNVLTGLGPPTLNGMLIDDTCAEMSFLDSSAGAW